MSNTKHRLIHVAAAVILDRDKRVLLARRPDDKHQGGLWEFPGGKVEAGEAVPDALDRELHEELGIRVRGARPLIQIPHHYADKSVLLDVFVVDQFDGEAHGREGQPVRWVSLDELSGYRFPAANQPILAAARLPARMLITGEAADMAQYLACTQRALALGLRWVMLRAPALSESDFCDLYRQLLPLCDAAGATLAVNCELALANSLGARALHLNRHRLARLDARDAFQGEWLSASCHDDSELARAAALGLDFVTLSPLAPTRSHPQATSLGWPGFARLCSDATLPVYALGGLGESDLGDAWVHGAQGVAAISAWWG
ncbi:Nudix family hydrolase [Marinobacterium rhizophilum]|uniref:Nudix family hydrolase n=1 Tax=Marinobacterium rhizophilum TaxID=420402 RepID=UPI00037AFC10|nr:Nudix family hydrolase [Marinobacterium rhizophilum]